MAKQQRQTPLTDLQRLERYNLQTGRFRGITDEQREAGVPERSETYEAALLTPTQRRRYLKKKNQAMGGSTGGGRLRKRYEARERKRIKKNAKLVAEYLRGQRRAHAFQKAHEPEDNK